MITNSSENHSLIQLLTPTNPKDFENDSLKALVNAMFHQDINLPYVIGEWMSSHHIQHADKTIAKLISEILSPFIIDVTANGPIISLTTVTTNNTITYPIEITVMRVDEIDDPNVPQYMKINATIELNDFILLNTNSSFWWKIHDINPCNQTIILQRQRHDIKSEPVNLTSNINTTIKNKKDYLDFKVIPIHHLIGATVMKYINIPTQNITNSSSSSSSRADECINAEYAYIFKCPTPSYEEIYYDIHNLITMTIQSKQSKQDVQYQTEEYTHIKQIQIYSTILSWNEQKQLIQLATQYLSSIQYHTITHILPQSQQQQKQNQIQQRQQQKQRINIKKVWVEIGRLLRVMSQGQTHLLPLFIQWSQNQGMIREFIQLKHQESNHTSSSSSSTKISIKSLDMKIKKLIEQESHSIWYAMKVSTNSDHPSIVKARVCLKASKLYESLSITSATISQSQQSYSTYISSNKYHNSIHRNTDTFDKENQLKISLLYKLSALDILTQHILDEVSEVIYTLKGLEFIDNITTTTSTTIDTTTNNDTINNITSMNTKDIRMDQLSSIESYQSNSTNKIITSDNIIDAKSVYPYSTIQVYSVLYTYQPHTNLISHAYVNNNNDLTRSMESINNPYMGELIQTIPMDASILVNDYISVDKTLIPVNYHRHFLLLSSYQPSIVSHRKEGTSHSNVSLTTERPQRTKSGYSNSDKNRTKNKVIKHHTTQIVLKVIEIDLLFNRLLVIACDACIPNVFIHHDIATSSPFWLPLSSLWNVTVARQVDPTHILNSNQSSLQTSPKTQILLSHTTAIFYQVFVTPIPSPHAALQALKQYCNI